MRIAVFKRILSAFVFFLFTFSVSASQPQVLFEKVDNWVKPIDVPNVLKSDPDGNVRYLLFDNQINLVTKRKKQFFHYASQPVSEQGLSNISQIEIAFLPAYEDLVFHSIEVIRKGERIDKLEKEKLKLFQQENQLKENLYNESWVALFILEDIRVGDIIEYSYSIIGSNPVLGEKYFGYSPLNWGVPVEMTNFRLISDSKVSLDIDVHNSDNEITKSTVGNVNEYTLTQLNVQTVREDDYAPQWFTPYAYVAYSQYEGWNEVNEWANDLYKLNLTLPDELIEIIDEHIGADSIESVTNMIQWVQDNIRYFGIEMGINSHLPSSPKETFNRRYGDCKDKAALLIAVLAHFDIEAFPVLVSTSTSKMLPNETPSPGAFNHVIVTFDIEGKRYWVDATMSNQRGNLDEMSFPNLYWGLVVKDGTEKLTQITPNNDNQLRGSINVSHQMIIGDNEEKSELSVETLYSGWQAEQFRSYIDGVGIKNGSKDHFDYFAKYFPEIHPKQQLEVKNSSSGNSISVTESYFIDKFTKKHQNNNKLLIQASQILEQLWLPSVRQRQAPFVLPYFLDVNVEYKIVVKDPKDIIWFDDLAENVKKNKWFTFTRNVEQKENTILVKYQYSSLLPEVSADEFSQYANLLNDIEGSLSYSLFLRNNVANRDYNDRAKNLVKKLIKKNK